MTEPCTWCPFSACEACAYKGGEQRSQRVNSPDTWDNKGTETAPGGASTPLVQGPRPSDYPED